MLIRTICSHSVSRNPTFRLLMNHKPSRRSGGSLLSERLRYRNHATARRSAIRTLSVGTSASRLGNNYAPKSRSFVARLVRSWQGTGPSFGNCRKAVSRRIRSWWTRRSVIKTLSVGTSASRLGSNYRKVPAHPTRPYNNCTSQSARMSVV
jgi:hypothetical protein